MHGNKETALDPERIPTGDGEARTSNDRDILIDESPEASSHISGMKLYLIVLSLLLAVFCVALDNTILSVAIPRITDEFHRLNDIGWYASAYLLTTCAFQLLYGKLYALFSTKWVFLVALFIFEVGSLICGVAPSSVVLIVGRAIAGVGSSGIFTGALVTIAHIVPLAKRPVYMGILGGMYGIASVAGPLLGGAFTNEVTWRWCFYINLPIGGVTAVVILFLLRIPKSADLRTHGAWEMVKGLDPLGTIVFTPAIICVLLALQWGGVDYAWSNGRIIALFVLFGVLLITFIIIQVLMKDNATVPIKVASQRSVACASVFVFFIGASMFVMIYYVPIWFQAIRNQSPVQAGIDSIALILANTTGAIISGAVTNKTGHYAPWFIVSSVIMSIGAGCLTLFTVDIAQSKWIGFLFLYGIGVGFGFQQGAVAVQAVLPMAQVPIGTALIWFVQMLGGALFTSVAQNIFSTHLADNLANLQLPGLDPEAVAGAGATGFRHLVQPEYMDQVLVAYNAALVDVFQVALICSCLSIFGAVGIEWRNVKQKR
ncbi:major facilitator superfamily domain-containing protein [Aspergillus pseudonomiae]|uniref:Major facilitator superfamily domain-containing protein n=1 Tax=Aspergillus pseudonomiae TaxID=1506151 RepID=A0A5N7D309_9EURO|nr:major facilitator superfamily domain-containing protein [Aspergillus pseudonomiae]KAE8400802.1 major facilitator superfamily domain-containing protein [Aspergillus pseudonomiae]